MKKSLKQEKKKKKRGKEKKKRKKGKKEKKNPKYYHCDIYIANKRKQMHNKLEKF